MIVGACVEYIRQSDTLEKWYGVIIQIDFTKSFSLIDNGTFLIRFSGGDIAWLCAADLRVVH